MSGHNLDVVQEPRMVVTVSPFESISQRKMRRRRKRRSTEKREDREGTLGRPVRMLLDPVCPGDPLCSVKQVCVCVLDGIKSFKS